MKPQVSMDSALGGRELGGLFNLYLIRHVSLSSFRNGFYLCSLQTSWNSNIFSQCCFDLRNKTPNSAFKIQNWCNNKCMYKWLRNNCLNVFWNNFFTTRRPFRSRKKSENLDFSFWHKHYAHHPEVENNAKFPLHMDYGVFGLVLKLFLLRIW